MGLLQTGNLAKLHRHIAHTDETDHNKNADNGSMEYFSSRTTSGIASVRCDNLLVARAFSIIRSYRQSDFRDPGTDIDSRHASALSLLALLWMWAGPLLQLLRQISHQLLRLTGARMREYVSIYPAVAGGEPPTDWSASWYIRRVV